MITVTIYISQIYDGRVMLDVHGKRSDDSSEIERQVHDKILHEVKSLMEKLEAKRHEYPTDGKGKQICN